MLDTFRKVFELLTPGERRTVYWLLPATTLVAMLQVVAIVSIVPFLRLVGNPDAIHTNELLIRLYDMLGFTSDTRFLIFTGVASLSLLVFSNGVTALTEWFMLRFSWDLDHTLSERMLSEYIHKPYTFFLNENTSALTKNVLTETKQVIKGIVVSGMQMMARGVVAVFILGLLVVYNPLLALLAFVTIGGAYGGIYGFIRLRLARIGRQRSKAARGKFKAAGEALAGVKDIKLLGREEHFIGRFNKPSRSFSRNMANQQILSSMPRYALETVAYGGMILLVVTMLLQGRDLESVLPLLGIYALASYRLMPALQQIFSAVTSIRFTEPALDIIYNDLKRDRVARPPERHDVEKLPFRERLELRDLTFHYPGSESSVLSHFSLSVRPHTSVAFVGSTGSGKTTTVDIILGLLRPQEGALVVDGVPVTHDNLASWQKNLGYVPQQIYLSDDTIARNIAFGVKRGEIDMAAVERAARMASIHDFIESELPDGYQTVVGERGVRLSGGQRQRLGIARALYHDPDVLVLDEATSALDTVTEESIFTAVSEIGKTKTVFMIAHRVSTVRACDVIYLLEHGRIAAQGDFDTLLAESPAFRALAHHEPEGASSDAPPAPVGLVAADSDFDEDAFDDDFDRDGFDDETIDEDRLPVG